MKQIAVVLLVLCLATLTACFGNQKDASANEEETISSEASAPIPVQGIHLSQYLLQGKSSGINAIIYMDSKSVWLDATSQDLLLNTWEPALLTPFLAALDQLTLNEASLSQFSVQPSLEEYPEFMDFELPMGEYSERLIVLPEGAVIFTDQSTNPGQTLYFRCDLADSTQYAALRAAMDTIVKTWRTSPAYSLTAYLSLSQFHPSSQVLRVFVENKGSEAVTFGRDFLVERKTEDSWIPVPYLTAPAGDPVSVAPGENLTYPIELASLENGNAEGTYRLSQSFSSQGGEKLLSEEYVISANSAELSNPPPPAMTAEQQDYFDRYLGGWGFYNPFTQPFDEQNYLKDFNPYLLYNGCAWIDRADDASYYDRLAISEFPAQEVENTVTHHFLISPEQFREALAQKASEYEYYDAERQVYFFAESYGGAGMTGVVTGTKQDGDRLTLDCSWYDMNDSFVFSHSLTLRTSENVQNIVYLSNVLTTPNG